MIIAGASSRVLDLTPDCVFDVKTRFSLYTQSNAIIHLTMIILYQAYRSGEFELLHPAFNRAENRKVILNAQRLLGRRGFADAAKMLTFADFAVWEGTNDFSDDF